MIFDKNTGQACKYYHKIDGQELSTDECGKAIYNAKTGDSRHISN